MDKNKKKTIVGASAGVVAGVAGGEGARLAKEWYDQQYQSADDENTVDGNQAAENGPAPAPAPAPTPNPQPSAPDYNGITEVVPVDTGGSGEVADVVIDIPQDEPIAGVDDVNVDEIAEALIMEPEEIIEDGILMAEAHAQEPEPVDDEELLGEEDIAEGEDEDLAESDGDEADDDGEMIDDIV